MSTSHEGHIVSQGFDVKASSKVAAATDKSEGGADKGGTSSSSSSSFHHLHPLLSEEEDKGGGSPCMEEYKASSPVLAPTTPPCTTSTTDEGNEEFFSMGGGVDVDVDDNDDAKAFAISRQVKAILLRAAMDLGDEMTDEEMCQFADEKSPDVKYWNMANALKFLLPYCGDKRALTYVDGKGQEVEVQTVSDIYDSASRIAAYLQREMGLRPGDRALLLYAPGQEFILAFMGCLMAGIVAVPVYPPHPFQLETDLPRLNLIVENSGCKVALTDSQYMLVIRAIAFKNLLSRVGLANKADWPDLRTVQTDKIRKSYAHTELIVDPCPGPQDLAFLQYTSGSTSQPKGVMVTHANLVAQIHIITLRCVEVLGYSNKANVVSWLPQYHDMGLIGIFLECLASGTHLIYMTPISFLQDPTLWLSIVHRYQAAVTCAPNFAFALVQRKTTEAQRDAMDLSCVKCVICGAEPIRVEVMESFFDYFAKCGFDPTALMPAYGLAEFTLCATSQSAGSNMNILHVNQQVLAATGKVVVVPADAPGAVCYVGAGTPVSQAGTVCRIVDPATRECQGEGRVGEIWLDGPAKTQGYFDDEVKTQGAYQGLIKGEENSGHVYMQTEDQGFLYKGHLFITGRLKDLIVIRGRTLYPQDIEYAVEIELASILRPGCSGAFEHDLVLNGEEEKTVAYVAELREKTTDQQLLQETADAARRIIAQQFQVCVSVVVLVEPRAIPKTTSGKIQRHKCKLGYKERSLKTCHVWEAASSGKGSVAAPPSQPSKMVCSWARVPVWWVLSSAMAYFAVVWWKWVTASMWAPTQ